MLMQSRLPFPRRVTNTGSLSPLEFKEASRTAVTARGARHSLRDVPPLMKLPAELMCEILDHLYLALRLPDVLPYDEALENVLKESNRPSQLVMDGQRQHANVLHTSRWWYENGVGNLYSRPCIRNPDHLHWLLRAVARKPGLGVHTRNIWIIWERTSDGTHSDKWSRLSITPSFRRLHEPVLKLTRACPNLTSIRLNCHGQSRSDGHSPFSRPPLGGALCLRLKDINLSYSEKSITDLLPSSTRYKTLERLVIQLSYFHLDMKMPSFPVLRDLELFGVNGAVTIPLGMSSLRLLSFVGNDIDSSSISQSLYTYSSQLRELHLIGKNEWNALKALQLPRFKALQTLAIGALDSMKAHDPDSIKLPPALRTLIITTWTAHDCRKYHRTLSSAWLVNSPPPDTLERICSLCPGPCSQLSKLRSVSKRYRISALHEEIVPDPEGGGDRNKADVLPPIMKLSLLKRWVWKHAHSEQPPFLLSKLVP